ADAGRPPQDHRVDAARVERDGERLAGAQQVALADDLVDRARPQALGERRAGGRRRGEEVGHDASRIQCPGMGAPRLIATYAVRADAGSIDARAQALALEQSVELPLNA